MKKTLSLVLALVLALGVFCAPALAAEYPIAVRTLHMAKRLFGGGRSPG